MIEQKVKTMFYSYMLFLLNSLKKSSAELKKILTNGQVLKSYTLFMSYQYIVLVSMIYNSFWNPEAFPSVYYFIYYLGVRESKILCQRTTSYTQGIRHNFRNLLNRSSPFWE